MVEQSGQYSGDSLGAGNYQDGATISEVKADDGGGEDLQLRVVRHKLSLRQPASTNQTSLQTGKAKAVA